MTIFIYASMTLAIIGALARLVMLAVGDYPRRTTHARLEDAIQILMSIAWAVWAYAVTH